MCLGQAGRQVHGHVVAAREPGGAASGEGEEEGRGSPPVSKLRISACCWGQVWVVDLRKDRTILRGLVRALPQQLLPETWVAILSDESLEEGDEPRRWS
jgi:hypothetical protein